MCDVTKYAPDTCSNASGMHVLLNPHSRIIPRVNLRYFFIVGSECVYTTILKKPLQTFMYFLQRTATNSMGILFIYMYVSCTM